MAKNKSGSRDTEAERLDQEFQYSATECKDDMDRMVDMRHTLDASIDDAAWPTVSKIPISSAWSTAEAALLPALDYMVPDTKFIDAIALDGANKDTRDRVSWALYIQLVHRMRIKYSCARSIRDSFSVSLGYSIIEPITITPTAAFDVVAGPNRAKSMGNGRRVRGLRNRYVSPGKVVPYPAGTDFNGDDKTPISFLLDLYSEDQFLKLYDGRSSGGEDVLLKGNPQEIIDRARAGGSNSNTKIADFVDELGGRKQASKIPGDQRVRAMIPILKCFEEGKHTWMFYGSGRKTAPEIIYTDESFSARRNPMIKWDPWIDSDRWYPMSQPEADMYSVWAKNVWFNAVFDLITYALKRPLVYDNTVGDESDVVKLLQPRGIVGLPGKPNDTVRHMDAPGVDAGTLQFGSIIDGVRGQTTGQRDFTEKNFARGGSMAFQDVVNSSTGRDSFRHAMLQMGGLESMSYQVLAYMQVFGSAIDLNFHRQSPTRGGDNIEQFAVTEDDLRHSYELILDFDSKRRFGSVDSQMKLQIYDRKVKSRYYRQFEVAQSLCSNEVEAQREVFPREEVDAKQEEDEAAALEATRGGGAPAAGGGAGIEQALTGAALGGAQ